VLYARHVLNNATEGVMNLSVDLVLIVVNLLALAYSYGRFSEKIGSLEKSMEALTQVMISLKSDFYPNKDGVKLEGQVAALWKKLDESKENK